MITLLDAMRAAFLRAQADMLDPPEQRTLHPHRVGDRVAAAIACETCGARKGAPCTKIYGRRNHKRNVGDAIYPPHASRVHAYKRKTRGESNHK